MSEITEEFYKEIVIRSVSTKEMETLKQLINSNLWIKIPDGYHIVKSPWTIVVSIMEDNEYLCLFMNSETGGMGNFSSEVSEKLYKHILAKDN